MEINPTDIPAAALNRIILGSVVPRPIAWVSTADQSGKPNLAPFSFFNAVCYNPPTLLFCPGVRGTDSGTKDTYHNIRATNEFVINIVTEELAEPMNITATELPAEINEFELAGLIEAPSVRVRPPRVAQSPVSFECTLNQIVEIGDGSPGSGWVVIGNVVHIHVADEVLLPDYKIDIRALKPVGRLAGFNYVRVNDVFEIKRLPSQLAVKEK
ncbi:MAG: flavin reductase family protein [Chloroflexi bacterium]|nr:flavin reductase family protein [Chloroflexota bacterium]